MKAKRILSVLGVVIVAVLATLYINLENDERDISERKVAGATFKLLDIEGVRVRAEIASTSDKMSLGLGGREVLEEGKGMWFVFPEEGMHGIWMKAMKISIDIVWFDKNMKIVAIKEDVSPESYPEIFFPSSKSLFVLELPSGFVKKHQINIGALGKFIF